jgi:hypothetical protein
MDSPRFLRCPSQCHGRGMVRCSIGCLYRLINVVLRFVMERTEAKISIWFWGRTDSNVPMSVREGSPIVRTKDFGRPTAVWHSASTCDFRKVFGPQNIIINLTLCESSPSFSVFLLLNRAYRRRLGWSTVDFQPGRLPWKLYR